MNWLILGLNSEKLDADETDSLKRKRGFTRIYFGLIFRRDSQRIRRDSRRFWNLNLILEINWNAAETDSLKRKRGFTRIILDWNFAKILKEFTEIHESFGIWNLIFGISFAIGIWNLKIGFYCTTYILYLLQSEIYKSQLNLKKNRQRYKQLQ